MAELITIVEHREVSLTQQFNDLIGCLENFDMRQFGTGATPDFRNNMRSLERIVQQHGSETDIAIFKRMRSGAHDSYSLLFRLERLHSFWEKDGFRIKPDLRRIRDLRNLLPHGRGLEISVDVAQEMANYVLYLTALARYHVFRALGCTRDEIGEAFRSHSDKYPGFSPNKAS